MRQEIWNARADMLRPFFASGLSITEIAKSAGVSVQTARRYSEMMNGVVCADGRMAKLIDDMKRLAAEGKTRKQVAEILDVNINTVSRYVLLHGVEFVHASEGVGVDHARADAMAAMFKAGKTLAYIGEIYGISRERVRQIIKRQHSLIGKDGGAHALAKVSEKARIAKAERKHMERFGCTREQKQEIHDVEKAMLAEGIGAYRTPIMAWSSQRSNALKRGIEWKLSLWDWWQYWKDSGKWNERGRGSDSYVMCRFKDAGAYEVGNVYIATMHHNATFQPNNPYRKNHPDHGKVVVKLRKKFTRPSAPRKGKKSDLPVGVTRHRKRFTAQIRHNGRYHYLGTFSTAEEAGAAYQAKLNELEARVAA